MNHEFRFAKVFAAFSLLLLSAALAWHAHYRTVDIPVSEKEIAVISLMAATGLAILWTDLRKTG